MVLWAAIDSIAEELVEYEEEEWKQYNNDNYGYCSYFTQEVHALWRLCVDGKMHLLAKMLKCSV